MILTFGTTTAENNQYVFTLVYTLFWDENLPVSSALNPIFWESVIIYRQQVLSFC